MQLSRLTPRKVDLTVGVDPCHHVFGPAPPVHDKIRLGSNHDREGRWQRVNLTRPLFKS